MFRYLKFIVCCYIFISPDIFAADTALYKYAINLESLKNKTPIKLKLSNFGLSSKYRVYQTRVNVGGGNLFYRARLGFFKTKKEAKRVARKLESKYPKLWVDRLKKQDRKILVNWLGSKESITVAETPIIKKRRKVKPRGNANKTVARSSRRDERAKKIMARANEAMRNKKYRTAVGLYTRIIQLKNSSELQQAMEFLGLAREKNGQLIHARAEYRLYLKKYLEGEDALRVRQRLLSLETLLLKPRKRLKKSKARSLSNWQFFGNLSQFYRQDAFASNDVVTSTETSSTNINVLLRRRTESLNIKSQFNANHIEYLNNPAAKGKTSINLLYLDIADLNNNKSIRLGRQTQSKGGVLGKMDGAWVGYRINPRWKLNMVAGFPVQTSVSNVAQLNRPFYGLSTDIGTIAKYWNFNAFVIQQEVDSIIDRRAVGGEIRYRKDKQNHFLLVDYDIHYLDLNTLFYVGNWSFNNRASVVITLNHRNSPILTTSNAVQGQATPSIEALLLTYNKFQLAQFALDRTAKYSSVLLSATFPFANKWSLNVDGTVSNLSSTPASAGIDAIEGTGNEFFYSAQLIGHNVFKLNETTRYQVRYDDTKRFQRLRLTLSTRFRFNNKWRFRPRVTLESRELENGGSGNKITAGVKFDYKIFRKLKLDFDFSYEQGTITAPVSTDENNYHISAGFVWDF